MLKQGSNVGRERPLDGVPTAGAHTPHIPRHGQRPTFLWYIDFYVTIQRRRMFYTLHDLCFHTHQRRNSPPTSKVSNISCKPTLEFLTPPKVTNSDIPKLRVAAEFFQAKVTVGNILFSAVSDHIPRGGSLGFASFLECLCRCPPRELTKLSILHIYRQRR